ncbi:MAG TPA: histidine phosphatase family protein [Caulobacterales bacterium]|nr:histidine phosphatase family protein [Caulobacterales bacterium]
MARIFLIRHGEPAASWHEEHDPGLSALGLAQAEAAAAALVARAVRQVVCSPLLRCRETAAPFVRLSGVELAVEPRVTEVPSPNPADRLAWLRRTFPGAVDGGSRDGWDACGEDIVRWRRGVLSALAALERDAAVFTHFIAINAAVSAALGCDQAIVCRPAHASITELSIDRGVLRLVSLGEQSDGRKVA